MKSPNISQRKRTFVIAEIAQAHDGSLGILHSFVDALAKTGVDAIKFQVHLAHAESSPREKFRKKFSPTDASRSAYWRRMELSPTQWRQLKRKCESLGVEFLATPFSNAAVDLLEGLGIRRYKVGSGDAANPLLLEKISKTRKEIILSAGLATSRELDCSAKFLRRRGIPFSILQCTTRYPTHPAEVGLAQLQYLRKKYKCPVGLSDHSGEIFPCLGAVALGAEVVEAHACFDRRMFGPDAPASLTIDEWATLVRGIRYMEQARGLGCFQRRFVSAEKKKLREMFGKALAVNHDLPKGKKICFDDLEGKKPAYAGIPASQLHRVVGSRLKNAKKAWEFLQKKDIHPNQGYPLQK